MRLNGSKIWSAISLISLIAVLIFGNDTIHNIKLMVFFGVVYIVSNFELNKIGSINITVSKSEENGKDVPIQ